MKYIFKILGGLSCQGFGLLVMDATRAEGYILFLLGILIAVHFIEEFDK